MVDVLFVIIFVIKCLVMGFNVRLWCVWLNVNYRFGWCGVGLMIGNMLGV